MLDLIPGIMGQPGLGMPDPDVQKAREDAAKVLAARMRRQTPMVPPADMPTQAPAQFPEIGEFNSTPGMKPLGLGDVTSLADLQTAMPGAPDPAALPENATPTIGGIPPGMAPPLPDAKSIPPAPVMTLGDLATSMGQKQAPVTEAAAPSGGFLSRLSDGLANNSDLLLALGAGFAGAGSLGEGMSRAFSNARGAGVSNQTVSALMKFGLPKDVAVAAATNKTLLATLLPTVLGTKDKTEIIKEYEFAKQGGFKGSFMDYIAAKRAGAGEYGLQPIYGTDKDGNPVIMQLGKSGEAIQSKLPGGVMVQKEPIKVETPTATVLIDPVTKQQISVIQKDLKGAAIQKEEGEAQGKAAVGLQGARDRADVSLQAINKLANDPDLKRIVGWNSMLPTLPASKAAALEAQYNFVKSRQFLDAYDSLRGAGAITEQEGQAAAKAWGNLATNVDEKTFKENLGVLVDILKRGLANAEAKAAGKFAAPAGGAGAAPETARKRYNPATGRIE